MKISGFDWDESNRDKCQKHGVVVAVIEGLFLTNALLVDSDPFPSEVRHRGIGRAQNGRGVFLVFTMRERGGQQFIRRISARYMHKKEFARYEKEIPNF